MAPKAAGITAAAAHVGDDRHAARQADLAAVRVAREVQAEPGIGCDIGQLGAVDEGDLEAFGCAVERRPRRVCVVVMDVVGPRDVNLRLGPLDAPSLIDQNVDAQVFEGLHHVGAVVVAEDRIDPMPSAQSGKEFFERRQDLLERARDPLPVVPGQHAEIHLLASDKVQRGVQGLGKDIDV